MNILKHAVIVTALSAAAVLPVLAGGGPASPHESVGAIIGGNNIKITYGRPYSKGRVIWGTLVPWDQPWRLGADKATTLVCEKGIVLGGKTVAAGTYTLYMIPSEKGTSKLAICKKTGQWGIPVDVNDDLAQVDLKKAALDPQLDQLTLSLTASGSGGVLKIQWEKTEYSVDFTNAP